MQISLRNFCIGCATGEQKVNAGNEDEQKLLEKEEPKVIKWNLPLHLTERRSKTIVSFKRWGSFEARRLHAQICQIQSSYLHRYGCQPRPLILHFFFSEQMRHPIVSVGLSTNLGILGVPGCVLLFFFWQRGYPLAPIPPPLTWWMRLLWPLPCIIESIDHKPCSPSFLIAAGLTMEILVSKDSPDENFAIFTEKADHFSSFSWIEKKKRASLVCTEVCIKPVVLWSSQKSIRCSALKNAWKQAKRASDSDVPMPAIEHQAMSVRSEGDWLARKALIAWYSQR